MYQARAPKKILFDHIGQLEFEKENALINFNRGLYLAICGLTISSVVLISFLVQSYAHDQNFNNNLLGSIILYSILFLIMLGNIAGYLFVKKHSLLDNKYITYISFLPYVLFLTWSVIVTFVNPLSNNVIISYMIGLLVFGTIPLLRPVVSITTILGSYLLYVILLNSRNYDVLQYFVDSSIFVACAIIASVSLYRQKAKDFQSKRIIIAQNKELFKLNAELQTRSITDSLTSYYNRYYLDTLSEKCNANIKNNVIVGVLMADIDNFKSYNDHFNHIEGDRCLVTISEAIKKVIAPYSDNIFRYGGEEFLIVFNNLSKVVIEKVAEEMRQAVDNLRIKNPGLNPEANITISIGGSVTTENETRTFEQLIYDADTALYNAKNLGKNSCLFI